MKLDDIDIALLGLLQTDAKQSIKELAAKLHLTKSPVYERIKRLEKVGVIERYIALVSREKLGNSMVVFCSVSLESQKKIAIEHFAEAIEAIPEVVEAYLMGGANDFLLKVIVKDLRAYHEFSTGKLAALPNVREIKSTFVLNEIKSSKIVPIG